MLEAVNISVEFHGRSILRDVTLRLRPGAMVAILGPNGAGKTTLLRSLNRTVKLASGEVLINGQDIDTMSRREIAGKVAVVAQENETQFPVSVQEFVLSGRFIRGGAFGWETDADVKASNEALQQCDLGEFKNKMMNEISGGERQRVVLARSLAAESEFLILDEPTANLDLAHQGSMFGLVRRRCAERGMAAAVITHDLNLASEFADEVVLLKEGRVFANGSSSQTLTAENISAVFGLNVLLDRNPASGNIRVTSVFDLRPAVPALFDR